MTRFSLFVGVCSSSLLLAACASTGTPPAGQGSSSSPAAMMDEESSEGSRMEKEEESDDAMMEKDDMEKKEGTMMDKKEEGMVEEDDAMMKNEKSEGQAAMTQRVISVSVENWSFSPATIRVKKGEKVTLRLKGISGTHGFGVPGLALNVPVKPGETKDVPLPTDKAGTFNFLCSVPCGSGHKDMKGQIIIEN